MVTGILVVIALFSLGSAFAWLAVRAWLAQQSWLKWPGAALAGLFSLALLYVTITSLIGFYKLNVPAYAYPTPDLQVAITPEKIARGEQLARLCAGCHASTFGQLPLDGSAGNLLAGGPPAGVVFGPNLTPGGPLKDWTDGEIARAIREGVSRDGRPLVIMPSAGLYGMSDEDVQALVAFLRSQPAVDRLTPARDLNALAAWFVGAGLFPTSAQPPVSGPVHAPASGTLERGRYLVHNYSCRDCHGLTLTGGASPFAPKGPDLTQVPTYLSEKGFRLKFRKNALDRVLVPGDMPWKSYSELLSDQDLQDIYTYLTTLTAIVDKQ